MLFIVRAILAILYGLLVCILGSLYCLLSPRNPRHVARFAHLIARMSTLFGIKVEQRLPLNIQNMVTVFISPIIKIITTW